MNAPQIQDYRLTAFVFGAVFNLLALGINEPLILYAIKSIVGGFIWLGFQVAASYFAYRMRLKEMKHSASEKKYDAEQENEDNEKKKNS